MVKRVALGSIGLLGILGVPDAGAQPYPGCPFKTYTVYSVCSDNPGVPGFTPGFTLTPGVPGTFRPQGLYTPIQGDPGRCDDRRRGVVNGYCSGIPV